MVDAQGAAVPQRVADGFGVVTVTVFAMASAVGRREGPVLAGGRKIVRRRTDAAAGHEEERCAQRSEPQRSVASARS